MQWRNYWQMNRHLRDDGEVLLNDVECLQEFRVSQYSYALLRHVSHSPHPPAPQESTGLKVERQTFTNTQTAS